MLSKQTLMTISPCWFLLCGCRCFFACRWLPGWVHHAVEHRCARCGGFCQPQVCLQSASQLGLYIGITVSVWPCVSQPLCFWNWGFILESLCPSDHVSASLSAFWNWVLYWNLCVCHWLCQSAYQLGLCIGITVSVWHMCSGFVWKISSALLNLLQPNSVR